MSSIGIFGGTFDPIHYGHLRTAFEMLQALAFDEVRFIPAGDPPHRGETIAAAADRYEMVRVAIVSPRCGGSPAGMKRTSSNASACSISKAVRRWP